ncbi:hypothetical protein T12_16583 [Trichinella patagoniensis]|uniref:Uncharacterized protein n=1 Tax=Trichinella patagoniensis TaxID=990121 RepID=A0A0V0YPI1_9BILA|nr:hypothetical protein T12_16583 [Trichinella patagoniensis]
MKYRNISTFMKLSVDTARCSFHFIGNSTQQCAFIFLLFKVVDQSLIKV